MLRIGKTPLIITLMLLLAGCSVTKYVPDDGYLLNKVKIVSDAKDIGQDQLSGYLRQTPNAGIFGLWKAQVNLYSLSGPDTTRRWNRFLRKLGTPPELFDADLTQTSREQIQMAMRNKGYLNAIVTDSVDTHQHKRANVYYRVTANQPYRIHQYDILAQQEDLKRIAGDSTRRKLQSGALFDIDQMDAERDRIATVMQRRGYYNFDKDYLHFLADSSLNSNQVDVALGLRPYILSAPDSVREAIFRKYTIRRVIFMANATQSAPTDSTQIDSLNIGQYKFVYIGKRLLRPGVLIDNCLIIPGQTYNALRVDRTYEALNKLSPVRYVNIAMRDVGQGLLDCYVVVTPNKKQTASIEGEGTYSAGDFGIAGTLGYTHRNAFRGAEEFSLKLHAAYEWRQNADNDIEIGADMGLKFPNVLFPFLSTETKQRLRAQTGINISYNLQKRPSEYTRTIAGAGIRYTWQARRSPLSHAFDLLDINYVYLPWISDAFRQYFINDQSIMRYSFEDHLIMRIGYSGSYTSYKASQPLRNYVAMHYGIETAGNLLWGINHLAGTRQADDGSYRVFDIRYSQYVKADFDIVYHQIFSKNNRIVYHLALGSGIPYGNANSLPFEKRYYSGGANSVRGWSVRTLGPGTYRSRGNRIDINNQAGDLRLDMNLEYRPKLFWKLDGALFFDAGNIWTIRQYDSQPGGEFKWDSFMKEIAMSYGIGLRLDFSFFVFRIDYGIKLYDPSLTASHRWRTAPTWRDDMAFHFAIGYPF
ncbi:MAG: BamA/TamA family outer membrane protein [Paludibacteraceae bacterium]|nr:BamA/TamA family outer membrane protein [Paludibacteraceae bacterium]